MLYVPNTPDPILMDIVGKAEAQGADITNPMVFDEAEGLRGFETVVGDQCPFLLEFLNEDNIPPFLVKIEPAGPVTESTQDFIQRANQVIKEMRGY